MKNLYPTILCVLVLFSGLTRIQARDLSSITGNTIASDQTICSNTVPVALTGTIPGGGNGVYSYQWQVSSISGVAGFTSIGSANGLGYAPAVLTATRWYRRIVTSGLEKDTALAVQITVTPVITHSANTITASQLICSGSTPLTLAGSNPAGGNGTYNYQWQSSTDNLAWTDLSGATNIQFSPGVLTANTWYRRIVSSGGCSDASISVKMTVTSVITSNTISADQSLCSGQTALALTGSSPAGGTGGFTYSWQSSTTSATSGFGPAAGTINGKNYSPAAQTQTAWYRRVVISGGCSDTSAAVQVTVVSSIPGNPSVFGDNTWNVYAYSDNAFTTYAGYYTEPSLSFATTSRYTTAQSPSTASGYQGCLVLPTNFSVSMKRTDFSPGDYQIDLSGLDDNIFLLVNGVQVYTKNCCVTPPATLNNIWTGYLGATDQVELRWVQLGSGSRLGVNFTPVTPAPLVAGAVSKDMSVCYGEAPAAGFTSVAPPSSGCTLTGVQWQRSIDSITWVPISGATALTYTEAAALTQTTWYRRMSTDACKNSVATLPVKITVNVVPPGDPTVYGNNTWNVYVYQGTTPFTSAAYKGWYTEPLLSFDSRNRWASGTSPSAASGYQGCYVAPTNHWVDYKRTNFSPAVYQIDIPGHDDDAYLFINGIQVFVHNGCCDTHTNVWTGPLGPADQVEYRVSQGGGGAFQMLSLTPVTPAPLTAGTITPDQSICAGNVPPAPLTQNAAPTGGCTLKTYQWEYSNDNGVTWNTISGATAINYTITSSIYSQTLYRRTVYDVCGNSAISNTATVSMNSTAPGDPTVYGNNTWNVYCFQDVNYTLYAGYYTEPLLTFASTNRYSANLAPSTASGYQGCQLINTYYSVSMKRTGFTPGLYQIDVTADDDYNSIYINGALVSSLTYPTIQNNVWTGNLSAADQIEIRWRNNAGPGQTGVRFTLISTIPLSAGSVVAYNPNLCANDIPVVNEVTPATGGCFANYSWQSSTDGGSTWNPITGATTNSYTAAVSPTTNIQYRRVATDVCGAVAYSAPVSFVQTAGTVGDPSIYGNGTWNVYAYEANGTAFSTAKYRGYYTEPALSFNSLTRWGTNNAPSDASGYQGCQVDQDNHWVSYRRTNFTPGTYQIDVASHDDDGYLFINGVQVWVHVGCCDAHPNVWTGVLGASDQVEFRWREFNGGSNGALNFTLVTPATTISGGTVSNTQTICSNTVPVAFSSVTDAASSCYINYQWQSSPDNIVWSDVPSAIANTYAPLALSAKTFFRRKAVNACGVSAYSNVLTVNIYSTVLTGGTIAVNQILCSGATAGTLTSTALPTGGDGNYIYQWQSSPDNIGWSNIAAATATTYAPGVLTATTYFRRKVTACGAAASASSNVITITVNQLPLITTQPGNAAACLNGSTGISVSATGTTLTYQWQVNTGTVWSNLTNSAPYSGVTTSTLSINPVPVSMNGYQYRVMVTGTCTPPATSNPSTLSVGNNPVIAVQPVNTAACVGATVNIPVTASGTGLGYQWQQKIGAGAWTTLSPAGIYSGTNSAVLTLTGVTAPMNNYAYQCIVTSSCGGTVTSGTAVLTIAAAINNTISSDQSVCPGLNAANLTGTTGAYTYAWQSSTVSTTTGFVPASGVNNGSGYAPNPVSATTYYRRLVTNAGCSGLSNVVTISVNSTPLAIVTQPASQTICAGGTAIYTVAASGPATITYQWYENNLSTTTPITDGGIYSGSQTPTLTLTGATAGMNNYRYSVKIFSSGCTTSSVTSGSATLVTNSAPVVTVNTADFSTCSGNNVAINITATGVGLSYQWQFNSGSGWNNLSNYGNYSNVNSNSLRIYPAIASMDGYQFRCIVTGSCSPFTATSATTTMTVNSPIANNSISNSQTLCAGMPVPFTGSAPTGGNGVYGYQWYQNTGSGNVAIPGAVSSDYTPGALTQTTQYLRQVTSGVCGANNSIAISATILPPTATSDPADAIVCAGTNTSFTVTATGNSLGYQWQVNTGSGWTSVINGLQYTGVLTSTLNVLAPAFAMNGYQYRCIVGGSCAPVMVTSNPATLTVNPVALITAQPANVNSCQGSTVSFQVTASGAGLSYQWKEKIGAGLFTNIADGGIYSGSGTATLTLTGIGTAMNNNQYLCVITAGTCPVNTAIASLTVNAQPALIITNPATICAPGSVNITDAAITAGSTLSGGSLTYWNDIAFTSALSNPAAVSTTGTYFIRVATSVACYDIKPVTVTISPLLLNNTISATQSICTGTVPATLTGTAPTGGTGSYSYQWQQSTDNISFLDIPGATNPAYSPGTLTADTWYKRTANSGTCSSMSSAIQIKVVAYPTANISYTASPYCATGIASITQTGQTGGTYTAPTGVVINASTGDIDLAASAPGTFTVLYNFSNGTCNGSANTQITIKAVPTATIAYTGSPYCATGTAGITQTGQAGGTFSSTTGLVINPSSGAVDLVTSSPGGYTVTYSFSNGLCSSSTTAGITINAIPTATIAYAGTPYCATGSATVTQTGTAGGTYAAPAGVSIDATTGAIDLGASLSGSHIITYSFSNGLCSSSTTATIMINALPKVLVTNPAAVCSPATVDITAAAITTGSTAGLTYSYFTDAAATTALTNANAVSVGATYYIRGTAVSGCADIEPVLVSINPKPAVVINNPAAVCFPNTVSITAGSVTAGSTGGLTYSYFQDAAATTVIPDPNVIALSGTYYIRGATASGCSDIQPVLVSINALPTASISYNGSPYCAQGTAYVSLTGQAGGTYSCPATGLVIDAVTGDIDLVSSTEGTYTVVYSFTNGTCSNSISTLVTIKNPAIQVNDPAGICFPGTVNLMLPSVTAGSEAGMTFNYYQDAGGFTPLPNPAAVGIGNTYYIRGTSALSGCLSHMRPVAVTIFMKPSITASSSGTDICKGSTVTLMALSAGNSIDWPGVGPGSPVSVTPLESTTYLAIATSTDGCKDTATVDIAVKPFKINLKANPDPVLAGTSTTLTTDGNFNYQILSWSPDVFFADQTALTQTIVVKDTSKSFTVIAKSDDGCMDTATLYVTVDPNLKDFFIPNSFSPNNDGNNDLFKIYGSSVKEVILRVYNQWGDVIAETHDAQGGWDGTWKGRPQPVGVYVYEAKVTFYNNVVIKRKGTVNLIR
jgi:gliding motility-associated-like protein